MPRPAFSLAAAALAAAALFLGWPRPDLEHSASGASSQTSSLATARANASTTDLVSAASTKAARSRHPGVVAPAGRVAPPGNLASFRSRTPFPFATSHGVPGRASAAYSDGPYQTPQPASWVDLDLPESITGPEFNTHVNALASELADMAVAPDSPVARAAWADAVADSDFRLRQMYGGHVWMMHHVQSHHLAADNLAPQP